MSKAIDYTTSKKRRAEYVFKKLEELYPETPVPLDHKDPYTLLIAVLLSAQCTDERVNKITPLLFEQADNPKDMLGLTVEEIQEIIRLAAFPPESPRPFGTFPSILMDKHGGKVPHYMAAWRSSQEWAIRRRLWSWRRRLGSRPFPLTPISIGSLKTGSLPRARVWSRPKKTSNVFFLKRVGTSFIFKLFSMGESIAPQGAAEA